MATEHKVLLLSQIQDEKFEKGDPRNWPATEEAIQNLSRSLKADGQILPVRVRPNPAWKSDQPKNSKERPYIFIDGRKRAKAMKAAGKNTIEAVIDSETTDPNHLERQILAANLWRSPLTKAKHMLAVQRYWKLWRQEFAAPEPAAASEPEPTVEPAPAPPNISADADGNCARMAESGEPTEAKTEAGPEPAPATPEPAPEPAPEPSSYGFTKELQKTAGTSYRTASRTAKIIKTFTEEQLSAFEALGLNAEQMTKLANIADKEQRETAITLVLSGMDVAEAIAKAVPAAGAAKADADLSDADWLNHWCGSIRAILGENTEAFDTSAIIYRRVRADRIAFRTKAAPAIAEATSRPGAKTLGAFGRIVAQLCRAAHPKDWYVCGECKGTGANTAVARPTCFRCNGDGFKMKLED
jgi:hypothetical protein